MIRTREFRAALWGPALIGMLAVMAFAGWRPLGPGNEEGTGRGSSVYSSSSAAAAGGEAVEDPAREPAGGAEQFISFTIDGKAVRLTRVKLTWYPDNHVSVEGSLKEKVVLGGKDSRRTRQGEVMLTFSIAPEGDTLVGTHRVGPEDMVPVYLTWYEVNGGGEVAGATAELVTRNADLDSPTSGQFLTVTFESFGNAGKMVKGTFAAVLKGDDGKLHSIEGGSFAIRRANGI